VADHERVFLVEQNRDAQLRTLLMKEGDIDPARLVPILHYDGTPITARFIVKAIADMLAVVTLAPLKPAVRWGTQRDCFSLLAITCEVIARSAGTRRTRDGIYLT